MKERACCSCFYGQRFYHFMFAWSHKGERRIRRGSKVNGAKNAHLSFLRSQGGREGKVGEVHYRKRATKMRPSCANIAPSPLLPSHPRVLSRWGKTPAASLRHLLLLQGTTKRLRPGFVNAAGKFRQKW